MAPGLQFPRVPGHEVVGTVVKIGSTHTTSRIFYVYLVTLIGYLGSDVTHRKVGQRLGVGWHGGYALCILPVSVCHSNLFHCASFSRAPGTARCVTGA